MGLREVVVGFFEIKAEVEGLARALSFVGEGGGKGLERVILLEIWKTGERER